MKFMAVRAAPPSENADFDVIAKNVFGDIERLADVFVDDRRQVRDPLLLGPCPLHRIMRSAINKSVLGLIEVQGRNILAAAS
jgi:hypothetical protein